LGISYFSKYSNRFTDLFSQTIDLIERQFWQIHMILILFGLIIKLHHLSSCSFNREYFWMTNVYRKMHDVFTQLFRVSSGKYVLCVQFFVHPWAIYLRAFSFAWFRIPRTVLARIQITIHLGNHFNVQNDNTLARNKIIFWSTKQLWIFKYLIFFQQQKTGNSLILKNYIIYVYSGYIFSE